MTFVNHTCTAATIRYRPSNRFSVMIPYSSSAMAEALASVMRPASAMPRCRRRSDSATGRTAATMISPTSSAGTSQRSQPPPRMRSPGSVA